MVTSVTNPRVFIGRRIEETLKKYAEEAGLHNPKVEIKYFTRDDPYIMLLWADHGITKGIVVSFGQTGELYVELYAAVDIDNYRKWLKTHHQTIPDVENITTDWMPFFLVTVKAAKTLLDTWKESDLTVTAPLLTDCGAIDIQMGSMPSVSPRRLAGSTYRLSPLLLSIWLFACFVLMFIGGSAQNPDYRYLCFFIAALVEVGVIWYHITGRRVKRGR